MNNRVWKWADQYQVLASSVLALILVVAMCWCAIEQIPTPDLLEFAVTLALGYFFGAQTQRFTNGRNHAANAKAAAIRAEHERLEG